MTEEKTKRETTTVIWHWENFRDYSKFPSFSQKENPELLPPEFTRSGSQCRMYELWNWLQPREYRLRVYLTHFPGFVPPPGESPFLDFRVNLLERRHQAFVDAYHEGGTVLVFAPGLIPNPDFLPEYWIGAAGDGRLIVLTDEPGKHWQMLAVPHEVLKIFARPLDRDLLARCGGDDLTYWLTLARLAREPLFRPARAGTDYLPQYSMISGPRDIPLPEVKECAPLSADFYPAWSGAEFDGWMSKQRFTFAKTMRWCPHEYIYVWGRNPEEQKNYLMAVDYVHRNASVDIWRSRFQIALKRSGFKYWHCGTIDLLNRTSEGLTRSVILEDGIAEYSRIAEEPDGGAGGAAEL